MEHCYYCNDEGRTKEDPYRCKYCGREYRRVNENNLKPVEFIIPNKIIADKNWEENFVKNNTDSEPVPKLKERYKLWAQSLLRLLENMRLDVMQQGSTFYISAKPGSMVENWCYEMLNVAHNKGYKISKIVDIADIDETYTEIKEDYLMIIRISDFNLKNNIQKLNYIIPERESNNLITILMSTVPYSFATSSMPYPSFTRPILLEKFLA